MERTGRKKAGTQTDPSAFILRLKSIGKEILVQILKVGQFLKIDKPVPDFLMRQAVKTPEAEILDIKRGHDTSENDRLPERCLRQVLYIARYPINPPAKESPAPVGSKIESRG